VRLLKVGQHFWMRLGEMMHDPHILAQVTLIVRGGNVIEMSDYIFLLDKFTLGGDGCPEVDAIGCGNRRD
jgi:hypothetical protein